MDKYWLKVAFAPHLEDKHERRLYRFFEILPGALAWLTLIGLVLLSWLLPVWVAIFIITFDLYWLFRTVYLTSTLFVSYRKIKKNLSTNWPEEIKQFKKTKNIWQLVFLPTYKEGVEVVDATLEALKNTDWPKERMIVVFAQEERVGDYAKKIKKKVKEKYTSHFKHLFFTLHPTGIPGELAGKGSNLAYAGRWIKENFIDKEKIPHKNIIVSSFDIDTQVLPQYFSRLTYCYLTDPDPTHASYQPVPFYHNNIWQAPALARVIAYSATFWQMIQQERPEQQTTFSSHSMSFKSLVDVGFWQKNLVSEDSRIFLQKYLHYNSKYKITSLYYPVSMDANVTKGFWRNMTHIYKQQRRWAWGVENLPYTFFAFVKQKRISLKEKIRFSWILFEGFYSWATSALIIFLFGWLPLVLGGPEFNIQLLSYNLPRLTQWIMTLAMVGLATSAVLSAILMPAHGEGRRSALKRNKLWLVLEWILLPINLIIFGSIPALESQTRLMLGKYMGFWVTEKGE
jgi:cellulose synthase/poly-beta-1,6-N-acetylglucosamine synthase-like glycosyltransferase